MTFLLVLVAIVVHGVGVVVDVINASVVFHVVLLHVLRFCPPVCLLLIGDVG